MNYKYKVIMNYQSSPCYPSSKRARQEFSSIVTAEAAIRYEFARCKWAQGTKASIVLLKDNGQHDKTILTISKPA